MGNTNVCCPIPWDVSHGIPIGMTFPWTSLSIYHSNLQKPLFTNQSFSTEANILDVLRWSRPVTRGRSTPWKNVLDIVWNRWTQHKKCGPLTENSSSLMAPQANYGPAVKWKISNRPWGLSVLKNNSKWRSLFLNYLHRKKTCIFLVASIFRIYFQIMA